MKRKVIDLTGDDEVKQSKRHKYLHVANQNCVYLLRLRHPTRKCTYNGSTQNFHKRLAQHNRVIYFSDKAFTRRQTEEGKYQWEPFCVISGNSLTVRESRQLEYGIKYNRRMVNNPKHHERVKFSKYRSDGKLCNPLVRRAISVLNYKKWTTKCDRKATEVPLTITWYLHDEKPPVSYTHLTLPT